MKKFAIAAVACIAARATAQVELRKGWPAIDGEVTRVDADGVSVTPKAAGPTAPKSNTPAIVLSWDRVRAVGGPLSAQASVYAPVALQAWRAKARLARGDAVGAEPLLDSLFSAYSRRAGPTSASIAQSLTACRLGRGAQSSAVAPWLVWLRAGGTAPLSGDAPSASLATELDASSRRFALDPSTGLIPALPPLWIDLPAVRAFVRAGPPIEPLDGGVEATPASAKADRLSQLYLASALRTCGLPAPELPVATDDAGVRLVTEIVLAASDARETRESCRGSLRARLKAKPAAWVEAWCRVALGRSLLQEDTLDSKRLGIIELLHVPSRLPDEVPYLTGIALAEASVALHGLGDDAGAERLRSELQSDYTGHPVLDWAPLRGWKPAAPLPAANAAPLSPQTAPCSLRTRNQTRIDPSEIRGATAPRSGGPWFLTDSPSHSHPLSSEAVLSCWRRARTPRRP